LKLPFLTITVFYFGLIEYMHTKEQIQNTLAYLRRCQALRSRGAEVSYTNDPAWLVEQAINRRGGFLDDPGGTRGSCLPTNGHYPKKASGSEYRHLRQLADRINTPRLIVRPQELGEWKRILLARIPHRFHYPEDD
jgi:hypothetical protein